VTLKKLTAYVTYTRDKNGPEHRRVQLVIQENLEVFRGMGEEEGDKIMICGPKEFCDGICRILQEEAGLDTKLLRKKKMLCVENW
jgi:NAD(P)H-flavin reductase